MQTTTRFEETPTGHRCTITRDGKVIGVLHGRTVEFLRTSVIRVLHLNGIGLHEVSQ